MKKRRNAVLLLLSLLLLTMTSCSGSGGSDEVDPVTPNSNSSSEKVSMTFMMPSLASDVLVNSELRGGKVMLFNSSWDNDGRVYMLAKQNNKMINLGRYPITSTNFTNAVFKVELNAPSQLDTKAPYQLYALSGAYNVDNNELFYRVNLSRNSGLSIWAKSQNGSGTVMSKVAGVAEILYVVNKTNKPIKFVHKGYDAAEKWYYAKAEVSVEDGHVQKAEEGSEVVGNAKEIAVFDGESFQQVSSYYVPTGKKIHDAQLIAEIDGKEVRSENRISSDITLQTGHAYGIFVIWDGDKLTLGDGSDEPVIHVSSGSDNDDYSIVEVGNDETITIKTTRDNLPKVGEFLASGPTEKAPYGFLCRVEAVEEVTTRSGSDDSVIAKIKKGLAYLDDVLPDINLSYPVKLDELMIDYVEDSEGNRLTVLSDDDYRWKFKEIKIPIKKWTNKDGSEAKETDYGVAKFELRANYMMDPRELTFFLDIDNAILGKWGVTYNFNSRFTLDADLEITYKFFNFKDQTLYNAVLKPIVIPASIPIVITPVFKLKYSADIGASLKINTRLLDLKRNNNATLYYMSLNPRMPMFKFDNVESDNRFFVTDRTDLSIELDGFMNLSAHPIMTFGLYGSNLADDILGGGFRIEDKLDLKTGFKLGFTEKGDALFSGYDGYEVTDEASMEIDNIAEGSVYLGFFNPFKNKSSDVAMTVCENDDLNWKGKLNLFYAGFKDVEAKVEKTGYVTFSATKRNPLIPFTETDCGFCYAKETVSGLRWIPCSVNNMTVNPKYRNDPRLLESKQIKYDLPFKDLEPNTTYVARPYVVSNMVTKEILILRSPAIRFRTDNKGQVNNTSIEDIPGTNLAPRYIRK